MKLMSVKKAAEMTGLSERTIYRYASSESRKSRKKIFVDVDKILEEWEKKKSGRPKKGEYHEKN